MSEVLYGYAGQLLRVDLSAGSLAWQPITPGFAAKWVGGTGLGARLLFEETPAHVEWDDHQSRLILASGPLGGTKVAGTGTFSVVFKGPMTNLAGATQASGFLGAFLKLSGLDAVVIQGRAPTWSYLYIHDGRAELRPADHLLGADTWEVEELIAEELGIRTSRLSVCSIGPAGENRVRFAALAGDKGHVAAHNGIGAVLGAKKLKAIAVARGSRQVPVYDDERLSEAAARLLDHAKTEFAGGLIHQFGTGGLVPGVYASGQLPVRNYTTNVFPEYEAVSGQTLRAALEIRAHPCWTCGVAHVKMVKVLEGPYAGLEGEEPEYEALAGWGPQIGNSDLGAVVMLSNLTDRLGLDLNESSWTVGWVMECYDRGLLGRSDLDGLEMTWGNIPAVEALLHKIARREGCGDWLAEGVMRASAKLGGKAPELGVYTLKGASPRGHDHRARWYEMLDTCLSNTSTIEASFGMPPALPGAPKLTDPFSPEQVSTVNAVTGGWRQFEDCLGICRFCSTEPLAVLDCLNSVTGWDVGVPEALDVGARAINQLRVFNFRHGLDPDLEAPSPRYESTPVDGPAEGKGIAEHFDWMKRNYWEKMGWDPETGKPLPETLERLGLGDLVADLD
ncbi:MAG: aldehyde ferredoxin oxidoreductase C-terminal domain-containing protein [Anaerolineae bacterium]